MILTMIQHTSHIFVKWCSLSMLRKRRIDDYVSFKHVGITLWLCLFNTFFWKVWAYEPIWTMEPHQLNILVIYLKHTFLRLYLNIIRRNVFKMLRYVPTSTLQVYVDKFSGESDFIYTRTFIAPAIIYLFCTHKPHRV